MAESPQRRGSAADDPWSPTRAILKSPEEIDAIARAGAQASEILRALVAVAIPGSSTQTIDDRARHLLATRGCESVFLNYTAGSHPPFPAVCCVSINEEVVHGVPGSRRIESGDLVTIDVGIRLDGWCADVATSFVSTTPGGKPPRSPQEYELRSRLLNTVRSSLISAVRQARPGRMWSEIALQMESDAVEAGYRIIPDFVGHGVGRSLHEAPRAPAYWTGFGGSDFELVPGLVLSIEPILVLPSAGAISQPSASPATISLASTKVAEDGWTVITTDGAIACHEERMIAVVPDGVRVLTPL